MKKNKKSYDSFVTDETWLNCVNQEIPDSVFEMYYDRVNHEINLELEAGK